jgi:hypothetical protein
MSPINPSKSLHLTLKYGPLGLVRATGLRIGPNSLLVDTGRVALADNSEVEVLWSERRGQSLHCHSLPARVCGTDEHGARLMFLGPRASLPQP